MGIIEWYKRRKRAKIIGTTFTGHWYDPVTEKTWMAEHRYSMLFAIKDGNSPESIAKMCHLVQNGKITEYGKTHLPEEYT